MQVIIAKPNQSMQDLVLMACGTLEGAMAFCRANAVGISDAPVPGNEYVIPDGIVSDRTTLTSLAQRGIAIGTLALDVCPMVTGVAVPEEGLAHNSAEIVYVTGDGGLGVQWRYAGAEDWREAASSPLLLEELDAETEYTIELRTRCTENYSVPVSVTFETAAAPPGLVATMVLHPAMMARTNTPPHPPYGFIFLRIFGEFTHSYPLNATWLNSCPMKMQDKSDYVDFGGGSASTLSLMSGSMFSTVVNFGSLPAPTPGDVRMFWSDFETDGLETILFRDDHFNFAFNSPLVIVPDTWLDADVVYLVGGIAVEQVSSTVTEAVVRVTKSHAPVPGSTGITSVVTEFWGMTDELVLFEPETEEDPDNPGNPDIRLMTLPAGKVGLGVLTRYSGDTEYPGSLFVAAVEVA